MPYLPFPTSEAESSYNTPGEINPGITPGQWDLIRGPFQLPSYDYNQAQAELSAREAHPRGGPDDSFEQLTKEQALLDQLSPFNVGMALGAEAVAPITAGRNYRYAGVNNPNEVKYVKSGSTVLAADKKGNVKVAYEPKPKPGLSALQKAQLSDIQNQLKVERALYGKELDEEKQAVHLYNIEQLTKQMDDLVVNPTEGATAPEHPWMVDPNSIPFGASKDLVYPKTAQEADALAKFGNVGERTPFSFIGSNSPFSFSGGAAPPPVSPARRIGRFNVYRNP